MNYKRLIYYIQMGEENIHNQQTNVTDFNRKEFNNETKRS